MPRVTLPDVGLTIGADGRAVRGWIEEGSVAPGGFIGCERGEAKAVVEVQLGVHLPGILHEELIHLAAPDGVRFRTDLGIAIRETEGKVGKSNTGGAAE